VSDTEVDSVQEQSAEPKRKRGRVAGFVMSQEHRDKIAKSNIVTALISHAEGRNDMTATQVTAALGLLKKVMPDLQSIEGSMDLHHHKHEEALDDLE
jgi:hypothetical protein